MLLFRPHHFLCTLGFQGMGYSPQFIANFRKIVAHLKSDEGGSQVIEVIQHTDHICTPCPKRRGETCTSQTKIDILDKAHGLALGLKIGDRLKWSEAKKRVAHKISLRTFHEICAPCPWKSLGVCEKALKKLVQENKKIKTLR